MGQREPHPSKEKGKVQVVSAKKLAAAALRSSTFTKIAKAVGFKETDLQKAYGAPDKWKTHCANHLFSQPMGTDGSDDDKRKVRLLACISKFQLDEAGLRASRSVFPQFAKSLWFPSAPEISGEKEAKHETSEKHGKEKTKLSTKPGPPKVGGPLGDTKESSESKE